MDFKEFCRINNIINDESAYSAEDENEQETLLANKDYRKDVHYFKKCKISLNASLQMLNHSLKGIEGEHQNEVMGIVLGKILNDTFIITDTIPLSTGSEVDVQLSDKTTELLVQQLDLYESLGRNDQVRGWYHSHPNFSCFLSNIDVYSQRQQQQIQFPFVAIVIDPVRTLQSQQLQIGAFRTYPEKHQNSFEDENFIKILKEEGSLEISYFQNNYQSEMLNTLSSQNWIETISNNTLFDTKPSLIKELKWFTSIISSQQEDNSKDEDSQMNIQRKEIQFESNQYKFNRILSQAMKQNEYLVNEGIKNLIFSYSV